MTETIVVATTDEEYEVFGALIREYWEWLRARYAGVPGFIDAVGGHQGLEAELSSMRQTYAPPAGKVLLALRDGGAAGGIAYRNLGDGSCEMKRLYVPERFQGHGTGRALCETLIEVATADGYRLMRLDTGFQNSEALTMYSTLGFSECPPYRDYPADLLTHLRFLEKPLVTG